MARYVFEILDSDGMDSTQEVEAPNPKEGRRKAWAQHERSLGWTPGEEGNGPACVSIECLYDSQRTAY